MRALLIGAVLAVSGILFAGPAAEATRTAIHGSPCWDARPVPSALRLPTALGAGEPVAVERTMLAYLSSYRYRDLGWCVDKGVRDTGPFVNHVSYGTHPSIRIYYSPEIMEWLRGGRRGVPRDGAVIVKEQYADEPASYFAGRNDSELRPADWTIMIRRTSASHDGWFWAELFSGMAGVSAPASPARYPNAGFGLSCVRCHASAEKSMTFASLENVRGFPGEPIHYHVDDSWRSGPHAAAATAAATYAKTNARQPVPMQTFPAEPLDSYVGHTHSAPAFVTSDQCMGCHSAASGKPFGPTMWATPAPNHSVPGINISEYGEWRWSPMGLAGRDPVFYAEVENEMRYLASIPDRHVGKVLSEKIAGTCMSCHGVMGSRALAFDHPGQAFKPDYVFDTVPEHATAAYGGLARDGISCVACHSMVESKPPTGQSSLAYFLENKITGRFDMGPPGKTYGQYKDATIAAFPMKQALGIKPVFSAYVQSSRLCASCHTINLPVVDTPPVGVQTSHNSVEQATYLEWLNSRYQDEYHPAAGAKSCQSCHMPAGITNPERGVAVAHIASRIALIQDDTYPETTHIAAKDSIHVRMRESDYRRHELLGLNAFLLSTFRQFPGELGVRTIDYMSGSSNGLDDAIGNVVRQAREATSRVGVRASVRDHNLIADVEVRNLTGHRFPTGVGFRRAFLEVVVRDGSAPNDGPPLFASGRTDASGRIVGSDGKPLPSESFARGADGREAFQEHFDELHPITNSGEVEIFEELTQDHAGNFTSSFIRRSLEVKDNRLLPAGWTRTGPAVAIPAYFLKATYPVGRAASDPRYLDGRGHAVVRYAIALPPGVDPARLRVTATLYYQSWAPYFIDGLRGGNGPAAQRVAQLVKHLDLRGTALDGWKLQIASASTGLTP